MIYFKLFLMFFKLCAFAFGGGYVMIPSLIKASEANHWATAAELTDVIAIAGMSPGPVAVNAAVGYGYKVAGFPGAAASFLGIALPCAIIVILVATFFFKVYSHPKVQGALYGLRPVITGIIIYAAISIALKNNIIIAAQDKLIFKGVYLSIFDYNILEVKSIIISIISFVILLTTKISPVFLILGAGILGVLIF
ncbi:chromate transporter [Ruminiclostridium sufflavum DSM 19573]|uniref:Chromate transporter n=1 Tax=Ruminiclostridium sufflavum DSM 19573 TaxID=1121337 RepID=A0A318XQF9_9FIRM|nr:chromate transporter [Ruminiclostridium sufflavum DSM 19573]